MNGQIMGRLMSSSDCFSHHQGNELVRLARYSRYARVAMAKAVLQTFSRILQMSSRNGREY